MHSAYCDVSVKDEDDYDEIDWHMSPWDIHGAVAAAKAV